MFEIIVQDEFGQRFRLVLPYEAPVAPELKQKNFFGDTTFAHTFVWHLQVDTDQWLGILQRAGYAMKGFQGSIAVHEAVIQLVASGVITVYLLSALEAVPNSVAANASPTKSTSTNTTSELLPIGASDRAATLGSHVGEPVNYPIINSSLNDGLHNQEWEKVKVKGESFKTVKSVDMEDLAEDEKIAKNVLLDQDWDGDKIEQVLNSGDNFTTKTLKPGDKLYGFDTAGREKNIQNSAYWLDEAGYQDVKARYYKNGVWDKEGVKNSLALPCFNRASDITTVEVTETTTVIQSNIGKARELVQYTDKSGYSTGMLGKIMPGGGKQITANTAVLAKL